ncbi:MAG: amidase [Actinomycetota bacterium]|nr:amidase [Actinomycetota bacterium]
MTTFIVRLDSPALPAGQSGPAIKVAIKDLIDMVGLPTTAGCRAVANRATPATADAACLTGIRAAETAGEVIIVGKTNLHELAAGATGINPWYGTPLNPLDAALVPGGSSSGSAVAVADGEADVALGSDTGGSVRIPSACCGTAGLKTTFDRVPVAGVWPLSPSLDTVGPMARDVAGLITGMELLEPGFAVSGEVPARVGRFRPEANPVIDTAIDRLLATADLHVSEVDLDGWSTAADAFVSMFLREVWEVDGHLLEIDPEGLTDELRAYLLPAGKEITEQQVVQARSVQAAWQSEWASLFAYVDVVALPTLNDFPPPIETAETTTLAQLTAPINVAGLPVLVLPVPTSGPLPASVQLVGAPGSEEQLLALGRRVEAAAATL